jgi:endonuclease/exonuclease/phosphatase family metal-dependent hydrolase
MDRLNKIFRFRNILIALTCIAVFALLLSYLSIYIHPQTVRVLPLFGLAYWLIILGNVLLLVTWMIMRSKLYWVIIAAILIGGKLHFRTFCFGWDDANTTKKTELKLISYNVRLFDLYNPSPKESAQTRGQIFDFLQMQKGDIYCFQEFYHQEPPYGVNTIDSLQKLLKAEHVHTRLTRTTYGNQSFGVAIFSKHKMIRKGEVSFSEIDKTFNYCIYADIVKKLDTFRVYNVHLQSIHFQKDDYALFNEENSHAAEENSQAFKLVRKILQAYPIRAEQAKKVVAHMKSSPHPIIVCGDFNDTPMSYAYNQFNQSLVDAYRNTSIGLGSTYAGNVPAGRIDYIFHDQSMGSRNFVIQKEKLSDHYAISCTLFND